VANDRLIGALRRQRERLKVLLVAAGVPVDETEKLLVDALEEVGEAAWEETEDIDAAVLGCIARACAAWARDRGGIYGGLGPESPRAARPKRRERVQQKRRPGRDR
jgi:hypothetical protein